MSAPSHRTGEIRDGDGFHRDRPQVHILDDNQWLFIRRRFRMSPRELEVARLVCSGLSNGEIASRLKIKSTTVKTHLRNIYRRVRVQRKLDMFLKFLDHGARYGGVGPNASSPAVDSSSSFRVG